MHQDQQLTVAHTREVDSGECFQFSRNWSELGYLVGSFFASVSYLLFPYCLIAYTSALRLIVRREQTVLERAQKLEMKPIPLEVTVWQ